MTELFLRRFQQGSILKQQSVPAAVFQCRKWEQFLSLHKADDSWALEQFDSFREAYVINNGKKHPGVLALATQDFVTAGLGKPWPCDADPEKDPNHALHHCTDCPSDESAATLATIVERDLQRCFKLGPKKLEVAANL